MDTPQDAPTLSPYDIDEAKYLLNAGHRFLNYHALQEGGWRKVAKEFVVHLVIVGLVLLGTVLLSFVIDGGMQTFISSYGIRTVALSLVTVDILAAWALTCIIYLKTFGTLMTGAFMATVMATGIWIAPYL